VKNKTMNELSVVIITFNEEKNIGRCIDSVKAIADEIIVLDSFSTDATTIIAAEKGAIVKQKTFNGYIDQKNKAIKMATYDLVLSLDADEALSNELSNSILQIKKLMPANAYSMNRCNIYCGHYIRRGLWYPDRKIRLFDRRIGHCDGINPHDKIELQKNIAVQHLKGDILHYTYNSLEEYRERNEEVSMIAANALYEAGEYRHWSKIFLSPLWAFVNGYFLRLGFLDGQVGFTIAFHTANQSYMKYQQLRQLQKQAAKKMKWNKAEIQ
jgi:glycosyltransferase involved in cell wall biosynthesis